MATMHTLTSFDRPAREGYIPVCELEGKIMEMRIESADVSIFTNALSSYPEVSITHDLLHGVVSRDDSRQPFLPTHETFLKKFINTWYENGFLEAIQIASREENEAPYFLSLLSNSILKLRGFMSRIRNSVYPQLTVSGEQLIAAISQTRDWAHSRVRCIAWHPHCTKFAVATWDDSIRIYNIASPLLPILKSKAQRFVSCMEWRPYSASELAVGCEDRVLVWTVDPNSVVTRPSASCATILKQPGHAPVTSIAWSPEGDLLLTASAADPAMYIWDVALKKNIALKRVGGVSLVSWSPNGLKVLSATSGVVFRVWDTENWCPERWTVVAGRVHTACWSPCGTLLLFTTSEDPYVYSLTFRLQSPLAISDKDVIQSAVPVIDLTEIDIRDEENARVGGIVAGMDWSKDGTYLALMFKNSEFVAVFRTLVSPTLSVTPCALLRGYPGQVPSFICFQKNFKEGSLLTIAWSSGNLQYFPFIYTVLEPPVNLRNSLHRTF